MMSNTKITISNTPNVRAGDFIVMDGETFKVLCQDGDTLTIGDPSWIRRLAAKVASDVSWVYWRVIFFLDDVLIGDIDE